MNNTDNTKTYTELDTTGKWQEKFTETFRYGLTRTVYKLDENTYLVEGKSHYFRVGYAEGKPEWYDFEGGPMIEPGAALDLILGGNIPKDRFVKSVTPMTYKERCETLGLREWSPEPKDCGFCLVTLHDLPTQP